MTAREFIENKLLPTAKDWSYTAMTRFIEACRDEWDKPDTGEVDEDAFKQARYAARGEGWANDRDRFVAFIQAYEQARQANAKTDSAAPEQYVIVDTINELIGWCIDRDRELNKNK
jgi:hypothetical protein